MTISVAVFNLKGGTTKSTTTLNLGAALALLKLKVVLLDLDGQRTLSFGLGVDGKQPTVLDWFDRNEPFEPLILNKYLSIVPGDLDIFRWQPRRESFQQVLRQLTGYQVVLFDCPPSLVAITGQVLLHTDRVLLPTLCEPASLKGVSEAVNLIRRSRDIPIEILRTRYRPRLVQTQQADETLVEGAGDLGYRLLYTTIPENVAVSEAIGAQQPVSMYAPKSPGAVAYQALAKECRKLWGVQ
ncbi:ParA family protein [Anthocerotibacter panamensis]|uniref:ParA family protein n=1 Tax=Anthocerotibacter panamensis TaxID=2857077 RepID=UPI001C404A70|nr:ParA family protein [Anthocerotibacter panamensis]